jgi:hypothetical protein
VPPAAIREEPADILNSTSRINFTARGNADSGMTVQFFVKTSKDSIAGGSNFGALALATSVLTGAVN